jgi:hypothetical protein
VIVVTTSIVLKVANSTSSIPTTAAAPAAAAAGGGDIVATTAACDDQLDVPHAHLATLPRINEQQAKSSKRDEINGHARTYFSDPLCQKNHTFRGHLAVLAHRAAN